VEEKVKTIMYITMKRNVSFVLSAILLFAFQGCAINKPGTTHMAEAKASNANRSAKEEQKAAGKKMKGISSWYGTNFHGKKTSSGETYNMYAKTAAHKTLPMHTMVRVVNLQNGKSTVVRINDRGPFVRGRIIDCSYAAGKEIGLDRMGLAKVEIEVLGSGKKVRCSASAKKPPKS
jgi:rare lipoprotein A